MTFEQRVQFVKEQIAAGKPIHEIENQLDLMDMQERINESQTSVAVA